MFFQGKEIKYVPRPVPADPGIYPPEPPTPPTPTPGSDPDLPRPVFSGEFDVILYKCSSDDNVTDKVLSAGITFTINIKDVVSIDSPIIYFETDSDLTLYNYAYINKTGRYYWLRVEKLPGNLYRMIFNSDPLMSFKAELRQLTGIMTRTAMLDEANLNIADGSLVTEEDDFSQRITFSQYFEAAPHYILVAAGGD